MYNRIIPFLWYNLYLKQFTPDLSLTEPPNLLFNLGPVSQWHATGVPGDLAEGGASASPKASLIKTMFIS